MVGCVDRSLTVALFAPLVAVHVLQALRLARLFP